MKTLWLVGEDVARSPSAAMHNAALAELRLDGLYTLHPTKRDDVDATFAEAERACRGINVTAPFKLAAARRYHGVLDDDARAAGAVNTVVYGDDGAVQALDTDVAGLLFAWKRSGFHVEGKTLAVVGSGGAARAVVVAAQQAGARDLLVHARRERGRSELIACAERAGLPVVARGEPSLAVFAVTALDDVAGMIERVLPTRAAVHDLRYGMNARDLRDAALRAGHLFADGSLMLLAQAQAALAAFIGAPLPERAAAAMRRALTDALRE